MRRRNVKLIAIMISSLLCLTSCSYKEFEDSLRSGHRETSKQGEKEYINPASITEESTEKGNVHYLGETVSSIDSTGEMQYTLNKVEIVHNINDLNLAAEDFQFNSKPQIDELGNVIDGEEGKNYFIAVYATVKNCNIDTSTDETDTEYPLSIESGSGSESNILNKDGPFLNYAVYFSAYPQDENVRDRQYFFFNLEQGKEMEVVLGWIASESMLEEPYYYVINRFGSPEDYQYVLLSETWEDET